MMLSLKLTHLAELPMTSDPKAAFSFVVVLLASGVSVTLGGLLGPMIHAWTKGRKGWSWGWDAGCVVCAKESANSEDY